MKFVPYLIITFLPVAILLSNFFYLAYNKNFYVRFYEKENIYSKFESKEKVTTATENILAYLRTKKELEQDLFSNQAKIHLSDVKNLISKVQWIYLLSLFILLPSIILVIKKDPKSFFDSLLAGSLVTLFLVLIGLVAALTNFPSAFVKFHQFLFANDLWLFPPNDSLVMLFPEAFFKTFTTRLAINIIGTSLILGSLKLISRS